MGAHPYWYAVKYSPDIAAALADLREREFRAGRYNPVMLFINFPITPTSPAPGARHRTIDDAIEASDADGTRSILDISGIADEPDFGVACPLDSEVLESLYGTARPTDQPVSLATTARSCVRPARRLVRNAERLWTAKTTPIRPTHPNRPFVVIAENRLSASVAGRWARPGDPPFPTCPHPDAVAGGKKNPDRTCALLDLPGDGGGVTANGSLGPGVTPNRPGPRPGRPQESAMKTHLLLAALALAGAAAQADPAPNRPADGTGRPAVAHQATGASHGGKPVSAGHSGTPTQATHLSTPAKTGPWNSATAPTHKSSSAPAGHWGTPTVPGHPVTTNSTKTSTAGSWKASATTASAARPNYTNYHLKYGKAFSGGYCYPGRDHHHWTYHGWSKKYHCECYWCPSTRQYYYWCDQADCYYPVSYYESAPCPAPEPACPTPAPVCAPAPCPPAVEYVTYQVPCVSYKTVAVTGYKTVTVARPVATSTCCPTPCTYPSPAPAPMPAPAPVPTPAPAPPGGDEPPADVPAIPQ